jgi:cell division protein FtsI (penicillin-binding protein 3)
MRMERMRYFEKLAKRTVGRVDMLTNHGLHGLELYYDSILIGQDGVFIREQYSDGIWTTKEEKMPLKNGSDLISTIDISIQDVAETSLKKVLEDNEAEKGIVVLMEVATGNVLSIVTLTRDSKDSSSYDEVWNNAIGTYMEQGSTMKLATLIAVLEEGKLGLEDKVKGNQFAIKDRVIKDSDKHDSILTLRHAFEISSNAAFADAAVRSFNKNKFYDYLVNFNLDRQLGVDLIGEAKPLLKQPKDWSDVSLAYIAHGYEIEVTPMQVVTLYNAIANNGVMVKPKFLTAIVNGNDTTKLKTEILNPKICSDETVKKVQECLVGVVKSGTSKALSQLPFSVAGKTGTAVTNYANKGEKKKYRASFVGYFPAGNPKYTCYVMIEEPNKGKKYGAELAVPVFKNIVEKVYAGSAYLAAPITKSTDSHPNFCIATGKEMQNVMTKMGYQVKEGKTSSFWQSTVQEQEKVSVLEVNYSGKQIPNLIDFSAKDAVYILEKLGLNVKINGKGHVKEQSIAAGENIVRGSTIYLRLG